uniref:Kinase n=1 Tax=Strigamia maritima TaxID=126957 RepID=T1J094_STRMM
MEKGPPPCRKPVLLEPFIHQVGGHSSMLSFDDSTVCKPLIPRELQFYTTLPPDLAIFTPKFKGVIEVSFIEDKEGYITLTAYPPQTFSSGPNHETEDECDVSPKKQMHSRIRLRRTSSIEIESHLDEMFEEVVDKAERKGSSTNPWVLKCHRDHLSKVFLGETGSFVQQFILLENLTWNYKYPCVLDLKMGIRQYGDDATPAKKKRQDAKVAMSTSSKLGVRICGMQVYQKNVRRFLCRNKYYGRTLSVNGFRQALIQFLHNGMRVRSELISSIVEQLQQLVSVLERQDTFRFYTSSLLMLYDGSEPGDPEDSKSNESLVETIDDGYCMSNGSFNPPQTKSCATSTLENGGIGRSGNRSIHNISTEPTTSKQSSKKRSPTSVSFKGVPNKQESRAKSAPVKVVDIRMIDFAHSTHTGISSTTNAGPDTGYIFGLRNLIDILRNIEKEYN